MSRLEDYAALVTAELNDSTVKVVLGKKKIAENDQVRRIVWDRSQKPCRLRYADRRAGGQKLGTESLEEGAAAVYREAQTLDRVETAEISIRAKDSDELELLFDAFAKALELAVPGTIEGLAEGLDYVWTEDESHAQRCPLIVLTVNFRVPVATETKKLVVVRAVTHTCKLLDTEDD